MPVAIASCLGSRIVSGRLLAAAALASVLPDADVVGFKFGVPYEHMFGHRGFSHSIAFAVIIGLFGIFVAPKLNVSRVVAFFVLLLSTLSHGLLDAMTTGGLGIGFGSPFSNERYFFDWRPIKVSPLSLEPFLGQRGWRVFQSELTWIWLPALGLSVIGIASRRVARWLTNRNQMGS